MMHETRLYETRDHMCILSGDATHSDEHGNEWHLLKVFTKDQHGVVYKIRKVWVTPELYHSKDFREMLNDNHIVKTKFTCLHENTKIQGIEINIKLKF